MNKNVTVSPEDKKKILDLEDDNQHTEVMLEVAMLTGNQDLIMIFYLINQIQEIENCMPNGLNEYRYDKWKEMKESYPDIIGQIWN